MPGLRGKHGRKKRKVAAREKRTGTDAAGLPIYTLRIHTIARDLSRLAIESRERTNREIRRYTCPRDKRDSLLAGLSSWTEGIYKIVRGGLRGYVRYAMKAHQQAFSFRALRFAEEQVSIALAEGLGHAKLHANEQEWQRHLGLVKARLSSLGAAAKESSKRRAANPEVTQMLVDDGALEWLRAYSSEWMKLACDDPRDGLEVFIGWQAPAWAVDSESDSGSDRATIEETENLLNFAAAELRKALETASFDAFEAFLQKDEKPSSARNFSTRHTQAIARLLQRHPKATTKDIAQMLDQQRPPLPILDTWLTFSPPEQRTWTRALLHSKYANRVKKMVSDVRRQLRLAAVLPPG